LASKTFYSDVVEGWLATAPLWLAWSGATVVSTLLSLHELTVVTIATPASIENNWRMGSYLDIWDEH
jgi:hypothetical protein